MSDKPDEKDGLREFITKGWAVVTGVLGAVLFVVDFYQAWQEHRETLNYAIVALALMLALIGLGWIGFSRKTITLRGERPFDPTKTARVPRYSALQQWIARISLGMIIASAAAGTWVLAKNQKALESKVIVLVAKFDGPEDKYGIHRQIVEDLQAATTGYEDTQIIEDEGVLVTSSKAARELGKNKKADLVIWAWYRPTENPNITIHIENLSPTEFEMLQESDTYQPPATLAELESFEIQKQLGAETSTLVSFLSGLLKYKSGDYQTAIERFEQILLEGKISTFINPPELLFNLGYSYYKLEKLNDAIQAFDKAIDLDPQYKFAYYGRGVAYQKLENYDRALQDYNTAIEIDPEYAVAYYGRGRLYYFLRQYDNAIQDYTKAIEIYPDYMIAYYGRGAAYYYLGQHDKAIEEYDKAIAINPNYAPSYSNRGSSYYILDDYESAIQNFNKAIEIDPTLAAAYYNRGLAYQKLGKTAEAKADFKKYEELTGQQP